MFETDEMIRRRDKESIKDSLGIKSDKEYQNFFRSASIDDIKNKLLEMFTAVAAVGEGCSGWRRRLIAIQNSTMERISGYMHVRTLLNSVSHCVPGKYGTSCSSVYNSVSSQLIITLNPIWRFQTLLGSTYVASNNSDTK